MQKVAHVKPVEEIAKLKQTLAEYEDYKNGFNDLSGFKELGYYTCSKIKDMHTFLFRFSAKTNKTALGKNILCNPNI